MRQKGILLVLIILLMCSNTAFSQGDFLERGLSGVGLSVGFSSNSDLKGFVGKTGYSASGVLDIEFFVGRVTYDDLELNALALGPLLTFYAIKQEPDKFPLSISFNLAYERDSYSGDLIEQLDWDMHGDYFSFGINFFGNTNLTPKTIFQPNGSISYITGTTKISDSFGNSESEDSNMTSFGFGFSMFFETAQNSIIRIDPGISINEDRTTFSISVGIILPSTKN